MEFIEMRLKGLYRIEPVVFGDTRGHFLETYRASRFMEHGRSVPFVQDNFSRSVRGVVRGLHYQVGPSAQQKLVSVLYGEILDVAVDLRQDSETFGEYVSICLNGDSPQMIWIPEGFAHGFSVLSEEAGVVYKCSSYYDPDRERGVRWDDSDLNIDWKVKNPLLSEKDQRQPLWKELSEKDLF